MNVTSRTDTQKTTLSRVVNGGISMLPSRLQRAIAEQEYYHLLAFSSLFKITVTIDKIQTNDSIINICFFCPSFFQFTTFKFFSM